MLEAGRSRVQVSMRSLNIFNWPNPSSRTMALGSTQPLTEMSTKKLPGTLNVSQPYGPSRPGTGIALHFFITTFSTLDFEGAYPMLPAWLPRHVEPSQYKQAYCDSVNHYMKFHSLITPFNFCVEVDTWMDAALLGNSAEHLATEYTQENNGSTAFSMRSAIWPLLFDRSVNTFQK
jgi:hypothetical protein